MSLLLPALFTPASTDDDGSDEDQQKTQEAIPVQGLIQQQGAQGPGYDGDERCRESFLDLPLPEDRCMSVPPSRREKTNWFVWI